MTNEPNYIDAIEALDRYSPGIGHTDSLDTPYARMWKDKEEGDWLRRDDARAAVTGRPTIPAPPGALAFLRDKLNPCKHPECTTCQPARDVLAWVESILGGAK